MTVRSFRQMRADESRAFDYRVFLLPGCRFLVGAGFSDAVTRTLTTRSRGGVREAPRHEIAGCRSPTALLALWGLEVCSGASDRAHGCEQRLGSAQDGIRMRCDRVTVRCFGCFDRRAGGHRAQGTDAGDGPARRLGSDAIRERRHDVSIRISGMAGGWYLGFEPRAKTSMTIMRPPQGHGRA